MDDALVFNGEEISNIPVINRPSYFLVNNFGRESYMTILEPLDEFKRTPERVMIAEPYKSVQQLRKSFMEQVHVGNTEQGYNRKDTEEVFFMGFRWRWRPNHKSFYGTIPTGYELLPLIARWVVLTGVIDKIDNHSLDYLPARYQGGTGRGFGNVESEDSEVLTKEAVDAEIAHTTSVVFSKTLTPIVHTLAGSVARAAQMNIVPKEAFDIYDNILHQKRLIESGFRVNPNNQYTIFWYEDNVPVYAGAVFGGGDYPKWMKVIDAQERNGFKVSFVSISADSSDHAESLMRSLLENK